MSEYFNKFPLIRYNDQQAINLLTRVTLRSDLLQEQTIYLPLTIQEGERADMVAYDYYGDSHYDWLIHYANNDIDPYYDYPLNQTNFENYIKKKYGSLADALSTVAFYQLISDPGIIINKDSYTQQDNAADWWPVSVYDYELYLNDQRMNKFIIRADLSAKIGEELESKLKG